MAASPVQAMMRIAFERRSSSPAPLAVFPIVALSFNNVE
jgi:hypothetical protein